MSGPLAGVTVVEIASIGPGPFCAMVLADMGAEVIRVERLTALAPESDPPPDPLQRGRTASIGIDLKHPDGAGVLLRLVERADVLVEGFRPGVMERLGAGPDVCLERNPGLVYGRITGWGQSGPLADRAGHDIDYLAIAGVLHPIGDSDRPPPPPLNLIGDFGGGGLLLAFGIAAALYERERSGLGQVIDAAMTDGSSLLASLMYGMRATGMWADDRASNLLDGGAPFYRSYETADGRYVAVGAIEPQFYAALLDGLGLAEEDLPAQYDQGGWPILRDRFAEVFRSGTRHEWTERFAGTDACVAPVNGFGEAIDDAHMRARRAFVDVAGVTQPAPAPRFSRTGSASPGAARPPGADTGRVLRDAGLSDEEIGWLRDSGAVGQ
jgi:alpha-methylacyl-CoA racemase